MPSHYDEIEKLMRLNNAYREQINEKTRMLFNAFVLAHPEFIKDNLDDLDYTGFIAEQFHQYQCMLDNMGTHELFIRKD